MAYRQYIDPENISSVYINSNDGTSDWEASKTYAAFCMVSYNNNFYMSRVTVPDTVGNPEDNPKYWAMTGEI